MTRFRTHMLAVPLVMSGVLAASVAQAAQASGETVYGKYCTTCHDATDGRAPTRAALKQMSPARILRTLDFGLMMSIAYPIRRDERQAVAEFLGGAPDEAPIPREAFCKPDHPIMPAVSQANWNGWSPGQTNMRFQGAASAGLNAADAGKLQLKWAFGFPGDVTAFGAPTVLNGTIFVGSAGGGAYAIDAKSGCLHWAFQTGGPVRSALVAVQDGAGYTLIFGDQNGGVYALDAKTGKQRWTKRVEPHEAARLTASPAVENGVVFISAASWEETRSVDAEYPCCTFRGSVTALNAKDGSMVWQTFLVDPPKKTGATKIGTATYGPSGAGVWSTPTVDAKRGMLYITTSDGRNVYAAVSDSVRIAGDTHEVAPVGDANFDPKLGGGLTALNAETGEKVWFAPGHPCDPPRPGCSPAQPGAVSAIPGAVFSGSMDGHVRAFSTMDGKVLWDADTAQSYQTVNGAPAMGGPLNGAGPVIAAGMVFVNSGYPRQGGTPGNVLLAFGLPDQTR